MLKRKVSPAKHPSTMKVRSKLSNLSERNGLVVSYENAPMPKTRFSLNDGSCSSPRLKSFPAEQIKRFEPSPLENPQENVDMSRQNKGQGDTPIQQSALQSHFVSQQFALPNENISSMSEQQVPREMSHINEQINQSELVIPASMEIASNERPHHRPYVPRANIRLSDQSPGKSICPQRIRPPENIHQTQLSGSSEEKSNQCHYRDPWRIENDSIKPLGHQDESGRAGYPNFNRPSGQADRNENININDPIPQRFVVDPNVSNVCPVTERKIADSSQSQRVHQRHQANVPNYYNSNVQNEILRRQLVDSNPITTSPQDVAMNQHENWHRAMQFRSHSHNPWINNNRIQPQSCPMNLVTPENVNVDSTMCHQRMRENGIKNGDKILNGNWEDQQEYYRQRNQILNQTRASEKNNFKTSDSENQRKKEEDKRKVLRFDSAMIKDQEMLVMTMRQQGIPEEIMRRQFDGLLAEQRKQLLYLEQLERGESNISKTISQGRRVQRKISKIEEDGKPEWMLHITPPRIPYSVIEKMRSEREINSQQVENLENSFEAPVENCRQILQNDGSNVWQQPMKLSHECGNCNVTDQHQKCNVTGHHGGQPRMGYYGYPMQQQDYMQQMSQGRLQDGINNPGEEIPQVERHRQAEKTLEPSSLLKLRVYKEVIRKQKQNNGLQDPETVREAMEALKNPANRKGLEYLENLNKKIDKPVSLNGAQEPQENILMINGSSAGQYSCQPTKMPSANGLENQRNPNNPPVSSILHQKKIKESQWPEYPRQRIKNSSLDCYSFVAEKENGIIASSVPKGCQKSCPAMRQNLTEQKSMNSEEFSSQSIPLTIAQENQNSSNYGYSNVINNQPFMNSQHGFTMEETFGRGNENMQQRYQNKNNEIQEIIVSGGLKYLARKPKYIPNLSFHSSHHDVNPSKYFNPSSVPCQ